MTLKEYFDKNNTDIFEVKITDNFHIFIQLCMFDELCIEVCDENCNSETLFCNVTLDTKIDDIKNIMLDTIIGRYFWGCDYE